MTGGETTSSVALLPVDPREREQATGDRQADLQ